MSRGRAALPRDAVLRGAGPPAIATVLGMACSLAVLYGLVPVPRLYAFDLESLVFWCLAMGAILVAVAPLAERILPSPVASVVSALRARIQSAVGHVAPLTAVGLLGSFLVFSLPIASLWATGKTTYAHLGGYLPWSDSSLYQFGGVHLWQEGEIDPWNTRRPLNAGFLATRLALGDGDMQLALVLQAWMTAAACFLAARELAKIYGMAGGLMLFALLYEFVRPYLGTFLSESLGLSFGCLGFAVLWNAGRQARPWVWVGAGLLLVTVGLHTRAGPFFVLPAILLWSALWSFGDRRAAFRVIGWAIAGICAGFAGNLWLGYAFGHSDGMQHDNLSHVLYGLAAGGKGWVQVYLDHPEIRGLASPREEAQEVYRLAFQLLGDNPRVFFAACGHAFSSFTSDVVSLDFMNEPGNWGHQGLLRDANWIPILQLFGAWGLWQVYAQRRDRGLWQLLAVLVGVLVSAPFLRDGGHRVLAASMPYMAALPAVGIAALASLAGSGPKKMPVDEGSREAPARPPVGAACIGAILVVCSLAGPMVATRPQQSPFIDRMPCDRGLESVIFRMGHGSPFLRLLPEPLVTERTRVPDIGFGEFGADQKFGGIEIGAAFTNVAPGSWIVRAYDLRRDLSRRELPRGMTIERRVVWLIADSTVPMPSPGELVHVCGRRDPSLDEQRYDRLVVYVTRINTIGSPRASRMLQSA